MSKTRAVINFLCLFIFIGFIIVLNESIVITEPELQLSIENFFFVGGAFAIFIVFIFMWTMTKYREFVNYKIFFILSLVYLTPIIAAILQPRIIDFIAIDNEGRSYIVTVTIGNVMKFKSIFYALSSLLVTYLLIVVVPKLIKTKAFLMGFLYMLVIILLGIVGYSAIFELNTYYHLFTSGIIDYESSTIGVFSNTNVFGYYLCLGIYILGILDALKHRFIHYIMMFVLGIALLLTITVTSYIGAGVFVVMLVAYDLRNQYRKHPISSTIWVVAFTTIILAIVLAITLLNHPFAISMREVIIPNSIRSFLTRTTYWRHGLQLLFNEHLFIGHGFGIANYMLYASMLVEDPFYHKNRFHQGWNEVASIGGLVTLICYAIGIALVVKLIINRREYNHRLAFVVLTILVGIMVQSIAESKILFKADAMGTFGTFLVLIPLLIDKNIIDDRQTNQRLPRIFSLNQ